MAFGRNKHSEEHERGEQTEGTVDETAAAREPGGAPEEPEALASTQDEAPGQPAGEGSSAPPVDVGDEVSEAGASAGDPAAAGVDAEGPGADAPGETSTHEVAAASGTPGTGPATAGEGSDAERAGATREGPDADRLGSASASPDPATAPAGYGQAPPSQPGFAGDGEQAGASDRAGEAASQAESLVDERPEVLVGAAFAGGLLAAKILGALGGRR